jgi:enoyl-CoA hydratase/carnithine racemase
MSGELLVARDAGIVTLTLNRARKLNALTKGLWRALGETMTDLDADESVRCIVLRGAGEKAFSPGNDIAEFATERSSVEQARAYGALMHGAARARPMPAPDGGDDPWHLRRRWHGACLPLRHPRLR